IRLQTAPIHLGDEVIPWYAVPGPSGKSVRVGFTVPDDFFSLKIVLYAHGVNSYLLDAGNTESTVSTLKFWQAGEEVSSGTLDSLAEDYEQRLPYGAGLTHWTRVAIAMPNGLKRGRAELEIIAGEDSRLPPATKLDDFEIRNVDLYASGVGVPVFVGEG